MRQKKANHIPFGRRQSDRRLVDVAEVKRGARCGCICPSCDGALIARQGTINAWHFAHARDGQSSRACRFSYYVSLRHMVLQLVRDGATFTTPHLSGKARLNSATRYFEVARPARLSFDRVVCDAQFEEARVDIIAHINETPLVIFVSHPGRKVPASLGLRHARRAGIIVFDLTGLSDFRWSTGSGASARDALKRALEVDTAGKKWVYHPRYQREHARALEDMERTLSRPRPKLSAGTQVNPAHQPSDPVTTSSAPETGTVQTVRLTASTRAAPTHAFSCVMCNSAWTGRLPADHQCAECDTHLFVTYALLTPSL